MGDQGQASLGAIHEGGDRVLEYLCSMDRSAAWLESVGDVCTKDRDLDPGGKAAVHQKEPRKEEQELHDGKDDPGSVGRRIVDQSSVQGQAAETAKVLQLQGGDHDAVGVDRESMDQDEGTVEVTSEEVV